MADFRGRFQMQASVGRASGGAGVTPVSAALASKAEAADSWALAALPRVTGGTPARPQTLRKTYLSRLPPCPVFRPRSALPSRAGSSSTASRRRRTSRNSSRFLRRRRLRARAMYHDRAMVDEAKLRAHLEDYERFFQRRTDKFVCPITLRECEKSDLIDGHILNARFANTSTRTVIQYADVDHFYGSVVEADFIKFVNMTDGSIGSLLALTDGVKVQFENGTEVDAFLAHGAAMNSALERYAPLEYEVAGERIVAFPRVDRSDPRLQGITTLQLSGALLPLTWVAALMKAAFLTNFAMHGYRILTFAFGENIRSVLAGFFNKRGKRMDIPAHFRHFRNAATVAGIGAELQRLVSNYQSVDVNILDDRIAFLHQVGTDRKFLFASTYVFKVNRSTFAITLPEAMDGADAGRVWNLYQRLLSGEEIQSYAIHQARFDVDHWKVETKATAVHHDYTGAQLEATS